MEENISLRWKKSQAHDVGKPMLMSQESRNTDIIIMYSTCAQTNGFLFPFKPKVLTISFWLWTKRNSVFFTIQKEITSLDHIPYNLKGKYNAIRENKSQRKESFSSGYNWHEVFTDTGNYWQLQLRIIADWEIWTMRVCACIRCLFILFFSF